MQLPHLKINKILHSSRGFTLIELLVTISVLSVLSTIAVITYSGITSRSRDNIRIRNLQTIKQALELYRGDIRSYPPTSGINLSTDTTLTNCTGISGCTNITSTYLKQIPKDSDTSRKYYYLALPSSPACDNNSLATTCTGFILCAKKEGTSTAYDLSACLPLSSCGAAGNCDIGISSQ